MILPYNMSSVCSMTIKNLFIDVKGIHSRSIMLKYGAQWRKCFNKCYTQFLSAKSLIDFISLFYSELSFFYLSRWLFVWRQFKWKSFMLWWNDRVEAFGVCKLMLWSSVSRFLSVLWSCEVRLWFLWHLNSCLMLDIKILLRFTKWKFPYQDKQT